VKRLGLMVFALGCASRPSPVESSAESSAYGAANDRARAPAQAVEGKTDSAVVEERSPKGSLFPPEGEEERASDSSASASSTTPPSALEEVRRVMIRVSEGMDSFGPIYDDEVAKILASGKLDPLLNLITTEGYRDIHPERRPSETQCSRSLEGKVDVCARGLVHAVQAMGQAIKMKPSKFAHPPKYLETESGVTLDIFASEYVLEFSNPPLALRVLRHAGGRTSSH
jgi:hypothetical protein